MNSRTARTSRRSFRKTNRSSTRWASRWAILKSTAWYRRRSGRVSCRYRAYPPSCKMFSEEEVWIPCIRYCRERDKNRSQKPFNSNTFRRGACRLISRKRRSGDYIITGVCRSILTRHRWAISPTTRCRSWTKLHNRCRICRFTTITPRF